MATENIKEDSISKLIENILSSLSQDPLLSDLNTNTTLQDLLYKIKVEEEGCIKLRVKKFDGTTIEVEMLRRAKVGELKKTIKLKVNKKLNNNHRGEGINWKYIWNKYQLAHGQTVLSDDSREVQSYEVIDGSELKFVARMMEKRQKKFKKREDNYSVTKM